VNPPQRQISVVDGENGLMITHVRVKVDTDGLEVTFTNPDATLPQIAETVEAARDNLTQAMPLDEHATQVMTAVTERLRTDGFVVEDVPVGGLTLNFEVDLQLEYR